MIVLDQNRRPVDSLPATGKCRITELSPLCMDSCPAVSFDDDGKYCIPDFCCEYNEEPGQRT